MKWTFNSLKTDAPPEEVVVEDEEYVTVKQRGIPPVLAFACGCVAVLLLIGTPLALACFLGAPAWAQWLPWEGACKSDDAPSPPFAPPSPPSLPPPPVLLSPPPSPPPPLSPPPSEPPSGPPRAPPSPPP
jgi:hypothetical protein